MQTKSPQSIENTSTKVHTQQKIIKFKSTNTSHEIFQLPFVQNKTIYEYKQDMSIKTLFETHQIKFIFKGKVLLDKQKVGDLNLANGTVMMVLLKSKKQKKELSSAQQKIHVPAGNLNTGLGSSSPVGFGGYGIMNHPQYMSAISGAVNEEKMQQMLQDPFYQQMMQQMLQDPQTLKQLIQQNPMMKGMMDNNPMMKMVLENPAMLKMMFNKDTIKMVSQMKKNGNLPDMNSNIQQQNNLGNMMGQNLNPSMINNGIYNPFMGNFGGMGGFGNMNNMNMNNFGYPYMFNPMMNTMNQNKQTNSSTNSSSSTNQNNQNSFLQMFSNMSLNNNSSISDQQKYKVQLKQLNSMGFKNKQNCIRILKLVDGDIDRALQKLCEEDN